ncbi:hypothetical protein D1BOALGB6SA_5530 [Olavius sp. associated proteobacterium Delta 1]|nr:hypothetical protein D1BOALGB6SA_5530 [Olavius sp. associated proteobacterium Delta 1]
MSRNFSIFLKFFYDIEIIIIYYKYEARHLKTKKYCSIYVTI